MSIRIGLWLPIFGAWLRNVPDERMGWSFEYNSGVARLADELGFETLLVAELNLNDIRGHDAPVLECWTTVAALAAVTSRIRLMAAIRPGFRLPAIVAKMASNIDHISSGRFELNLVSAWWKEEMEMYTGAWLDHAERYQRSAEFVRVLKGMWAEPRFSYEGRFYRNRAAVLAPKPVQRPWPPIWAGGESEEGREMIASECDGYLMHGDTPEAVAALVTDVRSRRDRLGGPPIKFGMAAYIICRDTEREAREEYNRIIDVHADRKSYETYQAFVSGSKLRTSVTLEDYSVSNRGLRPALVGTPAQIAERLAEYERLGVGLILAQCSPMHEEVRTIGERLLPLLPGHTQAAATA